MNRAYELVVNREDIDEDEFTDTELEIVDMLADGRCTPAYLAEELGISQEYTRSRLGELKRLGLVEQVHRGLYALAEENNDD